MKRTARTVCTFCLVILLALSLSSCSLFSTLKEYAEKSANQVKLDTPADAELLEVYNKALTNALANADSKSVTTSYSAGGASVTKDGEKAGNLGKAAGLLTKLIMESEPGKEVLNLDQPTTEGTILKTLTKKEFSELSASRNTISESVTNEKGNEVTDEQGNVVKRDVFADNYLKLEFRYYNNKIITEETTNEDGKKVDAVTERIFAKQSLINSVFGEDKDEKEILSQFDCLSNYLSVNGYETELRDGRINALTDLETECAYDISYTKTVHVTAHCTCKGALEEYGEITVSFDLTKNTDFSFVYGDTEE